MNVYFREMPVSRLILLSSVFLALFYNISFFDHVIAVYPVTSKNSAFLGSLVIVLTSLIVFLFSLISTRYTIKPVLIVVLIVSSFTSYFMDSYSIVIDQNMIQNIVQTDIAESIELLSFKLILYFSFLGIVPSIFVYRVNIKASTIRKELISKLKLIVISLLILVSLILLFSKHYTSFIREHKPLRYYTNPVTFIYSTGNYIHETFQSGDLIVKAIGQDAIIPVGDEDRELIILVVGEAARADRFSLNGYPKETNPLLKKEDVISFTKMHSCGTSTAVSVPCMFSILGREDYSEKEAKSTQNLLDVLHYANVNILWRDNNSDSKGVALNVDYEDYKSPKINTICDVECRDEGMLVGLQEYIDRQQKGDILIVLHQLGNHGPAYYKRYPENFEKFTPVCKTNQLEECSNEEIGNAYDNAILYTDYFLSKVIKLLKQNSNIFETAMVYLADHGESLGENGLYLHGVPYFMAPEAQTHIGAIIWIGDSYDEIDKNSLKGKADMEFTQDNLFHTILGLMEINTSVYNKKLDIINYDKSDVQASQSLTKILLSGIQ